MKSTSFFILPAFISHFLVTGQTIKSVAGTYADSPSPIGTTLQLNQDFTFVLQGIDPVFPYTGQPYRSSGVFVMEGNKVILNPGKKPRECQVELNAETIPGPVDSITLAIHYFIEHFDQETLQHTERFDFDMITIYINHKKRYFNVVRELKQRICSFAPKIKNQTVLNAGHQIKLKNQPIKRIGVYTYGFNSIQWMDVRELNPNKLELSIRHPVDIDHAPRSKQVLLKNNYAYYYECKGRVDKLLTPLKKQK